jgi:hypothetical protein
MSAQEDFEQLKRQFVDPIQHDYEAIRPVVLFSETAATRSLETGIERTVLEEKARRFVMEGMLGLADHRPGAAGRKGHVYPEAIAGYILYLKQLYPPIHLGVSHLLHMAFFTGLSDSRHQPYVVPPRRQSRTCLQLAVLPHGAESRSWAW